MKQHTPGVDFIVGRNNHTVAGHAAGRYGPYLYTLQAGNAMGTPEVTTTDTFGYTYHAALAESLNGISAAFCIDL